MGIAIRRNFTYDTLLTLKDAGAVTSSAAAQVGGANKILDLGGTLEAWRGDTNVAACGWLVFDITAIDVASGDEQYFLVLEGCNTADFSTGSPVIVPLAMLNVGHSSKIVGGGATSSTVGRFVIPWENERQGTIYRYVRMYHEMSGTTPSINYTCQLAH